MLSNMVRVQSVEHHLLPNDRQHQNERQAGITSAVKVTGRTVRLFVIYAVEFAYKRLSEVRSMNLGWRLGEGQVEIDELRSLIPGAPRSS